MQLEIFESKSEMALRAAQHGLERLRAAIALRGEANLVLATGTSQFEVLDALVDAPDVAWNRVTAFHLDEYVGLPITHPASFRRYLRQRFTSRLPAPLRAFHALDGEGDGAAECRRVAAIIERHPIDIAFVGIGENAHLAFNDPPADFDTDEPYLVVELDEACRRQQLREGWFEDFDDVPTHALSMSIRQIMKSRVIVCTAPDARKAEAVRDTVAGPVTPEVPASILQRHSAATLFLDSPAAARLPR